MEIFSPPLAWWHWLVLGIVLLVLELLTPGTLFLIFFGASAVIVALLAALGFTSLPLQVALFALFSVFTLLTFRRMLVRRLHLGDTARDVDELVGEAATAIDEIDVDSLGKVEMRGAAWTAKNVGTSGLPRGGRCMVVRVEGLTLMVTKEF